MNARTRIHFTNLMSDLNDEDHMKKVLSFAFGPGLTLESMALTINHPADA